MRHRRIQRVRESTWLLTLFLTLFLTIGLLNQHHLAAAGQAPVEPEPTVLRADEEGVVLEWRAPAFSLRRATGDDSLHYTAVEAPGWSQTGEAGQPSLPLATALVVVPPTGEVTLHVQAIERERQALTYPVIPARAPVAIGDPPTGLEWTWGRDEHTYRAKGPQPAQAVTLEEVGWMRGRRLVRLTFYPVRFDPGGGAIEVTNQVKIELEFEGQSLHGAAANGWDAEDPFVRVLQNSVVNPTQVNRFARPRRVSSATSPPAPALTLPDPPGGAEYLIIAHSEFIDAIAPLATHRAASLSVFSTTVEEIYAAYPEYDDYEAIKAYITHAYDDWPAPVEYVLLVGDGKLESSLQAQQTDSDNNFVPPYPLTLNPPWCSMHYPACKPWDAASDNSFVTVDGDDNPADVSIGRLPVNTEYEATTVVEKILSYETDPPQWPWNERILFFAGNESDAPYHAYSDEVYNDHVPSSFSKQRVYFCTEDCNEPHLYDDIFTANERTVTKLNGGGLLASYVGHSSWQQWAVDPATYHRMFHLDDVAGLHNGGALPVILQMTCYTSDFSHPDGGTLDETLLRQPGGGAVATWGSTTLGLHVGHSTLHKGFFDAVLQEGTTELGEAIRAAQIDLFYGKNAEYYLDLLDTFVLLGDPAMELNMDVVPWTNDLFLPLTVRGR